MKAPLELATAFARLEKSGSRIAADLKNKFALLGLGLELEFIAGRKARACGGKKQQPAAKAALEAKERGGVRVPVRHHKHHGGAVALSNQFTKPCAVTRVALVEDNHGHLISVASVGFEDTAGNRCGRRCRSEGRL